MEPGSKGLSRWLGTYEYCSPDLAPIIATPKERKKAKPNTTLPAAIMKTSRNHLVGLKKEGFPPTSVR